MSAERGPYRWNWPPTFLDALARSGLIRASARACGVGRRTVYDQRDRDPHFAAASDAALAPFRRGDRLYAAARWQRSLRTARWRRWRTSQPTSAPSRSTSSSANSAARCTCSPTRLHGYGGDRGAKRIAAEWSEGIRDLARRAETAHETSGWHGFSAAGVRARAHLREARSTDGYPPA